MNSKKVSLIGLSLISLISLAGCKKADSSASGNSGDSAAKYFDYSKEAIYSADLNHDGAIGDGEKNLTWANSFDKLIKMIKIDDAGESAEQVSLRSKDMHAAEDLLMGTGSVCPIYYYTNAYLLNPSITKVPTNPLGNFFFMNAVKTGSDSNTINACLASEPQYIDPALNSAVEGSTYDAHLFAGLYRYRDSNNDGTATLEKDLLAEDPVITTDANGVATYSFKLKDGVKFSDGSAITADDFIFSWNRAASGKTAADYSYLFDGVVGGSDAQKDTTSGADTNYGQHLAITKKSDSEFSIQLTHDLPYFKSLLAFPSFSVLKKSAVTANEAAGAWAKVPNFVTSGSYKITAWTHDSVIKFERNANYWDNSNNTIDTINFLLSDKDTTMETNFKSGQCDMVQSFPLSSMEAWEASKKDGSNASLHIDDLLGTYYACFNMNSGRFSAKADTPEKRVKVRKALGLLIDRKNITDNVTKQGQVPANSFVPNGIVDANGTDSFTAKNGTAGDGKGYFDIDDHAGNVADAVAMLKEVGYTYDEKTKKFTDFPSNSVYLYNTSDTHKSIAEAIQADLAAKGISINLENQEWKTFLNTRKQGQYDISRDGWVADYNDAIDFLDLFCSTSDNNDAQLGRELQ
ncbi:MAG: ABC transporter substrate-binding protein [Bacilli bacterium]|jgi:oligopeptide transport system substrate-binding protein|nr:ABC transporter substrate-binding protein [Bacilli bacterium]